MHKNQGFTLIELLIVLGIFGIVMGIAAMNLRPLSGDLQAAANEVAGTFKQTRARAMVTTSAHRITPSASGDQLTVQYAPRCSAPNSDWITNDKLTRTLREKVKLDDTSWQVCFNSRGLAEDAPVFSLSDKDGKTIDVRVFLGGTVELSYD